jgi:hypothetical protein
MQATRQFLDAVQLYGIVHFASKAYRSQLCEYAMAYDATFKHTNLYKDTP